MPGMAGMGSMPGMAGMGSMPGMAGMGSMPGMPGTDPGGRSAATGSGSMMLGSGLAYGLAMWALMVVAMMLPTALPAVGHVAANSLRWRRRRAMATFVSAYLLTWTALGALLVATSPWWSSISSSAALAVVLALAAAWQLTVHKRRALRDCHRPLPLPPRGARATVGVVRFAVFNSLACVRSCWAMMLAMSLAGSTMLFWMIAISGVVAIEKLAQKPRLATRAGAVVLGAGALVSAAGVLLA